MCDKSVLFIRFDKVAALGHHILAKDPNAQDIKDRLKQLADDQRAIAELWNNKNQELIDARDLQVHPTCNSYLHHFVY